MTRWSRLTPDDVGKDSDPIPSGAINNFGTETVTPISTSSISTSGYPFSDCPSLDFISDNDLIGLWTFEEGTPINSQSLDKSTNRRHLDIGGNCAYASMEREGWTENVMQGDTTTDSDLEVPYESALYPSEFTMHIAFNLNSTGNNQFAIGNGAAGIYAEYSSNNGEITGLVSVGGTFYVIKGPIANTGEWYYATLTYDGSVLKLFVNSELVASDNSMSGSMDDTGDALFVCDYVDGYVDDAIFLNKALDERRAKSLNEMSKQHDFSLVPQLRDYNDFYIDEYGRTGFGTTTLNEDFEFGGNIKVYDGSGNSVFVTDTYGDSGRITFFNEGYIGNGSENHIQFTNTPKIKLLQDVNGNSKYITNVAKLQIGADIGLQFKDYSSGNLASSYSSSYDSLGDQFITKINNEYSSGSDSFRITGFDKLDLICTNINLNGLTTTNGNIDLGDGDDVLRNVTTVTSNHTASIGDTILADTSGGSLTVTLPSSPISGAEIIVKKIASGNTLTIDGNGNNIDSSSSIDITTENESKTITSDGSNWFII